MKIAGGPFAIIGALLVTLAVLAAGAQGLVTSTTLPRADRRAGEPPLSDERKAHLLAVLHDAWRNKDIDRRQYVRDRAMLHLPVCAGLRVSELTGLQIAVVGPQSSSVRVLGKDRPITGIALVEARCSSTARMPAQEPLAVAPRHHGLPSA